MSETGLGSVGPGLAGEFFGLEPRTTGRPAGLCRGFTGTAAAKAGSALGAAVAAADAGGAGTTAVGTAVATDVTCCEVTAGATCSTTTLVVSGAPVATGPSV